MVMATVFVALPLVIREVVPVLEEIGDDQEQAARSLGANAVQTFRRITLPGIKWAVVYGVVLSLARSLGEFGAVKVVSGNVAGADPDRHRSSSSRSTRTSSRTTAYADRRSCSPSRPCCASSSSPLLRPKEKQAMSIEVSRRHQAVRRLRRARRRRR